MVHSVTKARPQSRENSAFDVVVEDMADERRNVVPADLNPYARYILSETCCNERIGR